VVVLLVAGVGGWYLRGSGLMEFLEPEGLRGRVDRLGWQAYGLYFAAWVLLVTFLGQTFLPTVAGGVMFGWLLGGVLAVAGAALGHTCQFWVARKLLRGPAESLLFRRLPHVPRAIEERGLALLVVLRFAWAPAWAVNLAAGVTRVRFRDFVLAFPAALPGAVLICLVSDSLLVYGWRDIPPARWGWMAAILAGGVGLYLWATRRWPELKLSFRGKAPPDG
jgi:uncharacterized membrane protein YdjX (TVP38/TMEM64 family)